MKKKVLHVVSISFSLKYFVGNQFVFFKGKGYDFTVACTDSKDLRKYSSQMGFKVFPIQVVRSINPFQDIISIYKLYSFIKSEKFDIVIAHSPKGGLIGMIAAFLARTPKRIFFRHGLVFETSKGLKRQMLIWVERITAFFSHKVVNVSNSVKNESIIYKLNSEDKNIILLNGSCNGIDIHRYSLKNIAQRDNQNNKFILGFVGRLCKDKGIVELIEAWKIVEKNNTNVELLLVGPFDERDLLSLNVVRMIETSRSIVHIGHVEDTSEYYNQMDVFILPSYREGFPTVVLEASATAIPVITTRTTGCIDSIVENQTGIFTKIDPIDIARSIQFYIDNPKIRIEHGQNGRIFVKNNFAEKVIYNEIEKLLSS